MPINLTINGKAVVAREGQSVLDVARENGINIPTLCHHPDLSPVGGPVLGPFRLRSQALAAEQAWLDGWLVMTQTGRTPSR